MKVFSWILLVVAIIILSIGFISENDLEGWEAVIPIVSAIIGGIISIALMAHFITELEWHPIPSLLLSFVLFVISSFLAAIVVVIGLIVLVFWALAQLSDEDSKKKKLRKIGDIYEEYEDD